MDLGACSLAPPCRSSGPKVEDVRSSLHLATADLPCLPTILSLS
eukprot:COSAG04_NODE_12250_length_662_cov_1.094139_3_plen_43_part_01